MPLTRSATAIGLALALSATPLAAETPAKPEATAAESASEQPPAQPNAGAYLAARVASAEGDYTAATHWFTEALRTDPDNPMLLEGATIGAMGQGRFGEAAKTAQHLLDLGDKSQISALALLTEAAGRKDYARIDQLIKDGHGGGALLNDLVLAWSQAGAGQVTEAVEALDKIAKTPDRALFGAYHKALALAMAGDFESADAALNTEAGKAGRALRRVVLAHAEILSQLERNEDAIALLDEVFAPGQDVAVVGMRERLTNGETLPWTIVQTPEQGMAEVFYTLASASRGEAESGYTLLLSQAAAYLRPDHTEALLTSASLLNGNGQADLAAATYAKVPSDAPEHYLAEIGRAETLIAAGKPDAALEVMQALSKAYPKLRTVHATYGDMLRREERYEDATLAYDAAIALLGTPDEGDWRLFFSRGICHERQKRWELGEADLRKALELSPDQPQVLNYLGYSMLEMNKDLDAALKLIERAVQVEPNSGAITDSLAWAYFRLGRYQDALAPMERASQMEPVDPVVTDHLGDVYWAVGRQLEARFQWRRALSYGPEEKDAKRIRLKLELGLDKVLASEGAAPLETKNASNTD
ncbi:tetratricopeptide repeat protein [Gemmobacter serpentinus]|uniref:tetratricopeptide repeat protein n=1 Tax=Gemmobacter serpentinus TaxID=2652247 RepID=UPI00124DFB43|nr:tetratricopeptide repeat protein [Gemmobacter serpentinus]